MVHGLMQGMADMAAKTGATRPKIVAMTVFTLLALGAGIIVATFFGRLTI